MEKEEINSCTVALKNTLHFYQTTDCPNIAPDVVRTVTHRGPILRCVPGALRRLCDATLSGGSWGITDRDRSTAAWQNGDSENDADLPKEDVIN
jgi:hypothetical protein